MSDPAGYNDSKPDYYKWERDNWIETARQYARNTDYYRGLVVKVGEMLGPEVYVSDDGSVQQDVLCAKVPELTAQRIAEFEQERERLLKLIDSLDPGQHYRASVLVRIGELEAFVSQYTYPGMTAGVKGSIDRERTIHARRLLGLNEETGEAKG